MNNIFGIERGILWRPFRALVLPCFSAQAVMWRPVGALSRRAFRLVLIRCTHVTPAVLLLMP